MDMSETFYPLYPQHTPTSVLSGSPLARSWVPSHLRPRSSRDTGFEQLFTVIYALSRTKRTLKHFSCQSLVREGLSPLDFKVDDRIKTFHRHMAIAFRQLQTLELQITPRRYNIIDHGNIDALGYLPQLTEQLANRIYLELQLISAERID